MDRKPSRMRVGGWLGAWEPAGNRPGTGRGAGGKSGMPARRTPLPTLLVCLLAAAAPCISAGPLLHLVAESGAAPPRYQVFITDPVNDTLDVAWKAVMPSAQKALEEDDWRIDREHSGEARLVTEWKN